MQKEILTIILLLVIYIFQVNAQDKQFDSENYESEILESVAENTDNEIDATSLTEELQYYLQHPLDINTASQKDFEKLQFLTPFQINSIIEYRKEHGNFLSVYELNGVIGLPATIIKMMLPFVKVGEKIIMQNTKEGNAINQMLLVNSNRTIELQNGYANDPDSIKLKYPNKYYPGNPYRIRTKYRFEQGESFKAGFSAEKDPGETWFSGSNKTFDFLSGFIQMQNKYQVKNLILGDYYANFGQGLVLWNGFAPGMTAYTINIKRQTEGFNRYSSFNENQYFQGIASTVCLNHFYISAFFNKHHIDANVVARDSTGRVLEISSLQNTGSHALPNEISDEDALGEKTFGGNLSFEKDKYKIGVTLININYDANFQKSLEPYKLYAFSGNNLICGSFNYLIRFRKIELFGEEARNSMHGNAFSNGMAFQLIPELSLALLYRYFEPQYFSPYANAFAQNSQPSNENGLYAGIEFVPIDKIKINAYADFFNYPFFKYRISEPSSGTNYFFEITYEPSDNISLSSRYSALQKQEDGNTIEPNPPALENVSLQKVRFHAVYKISTSVELRNRLELVYYNKHNSPKQNGYLLFQDIIWKPEKIRLSLVARYAIFETGGYESRIYSYESDVLYSYSIPAYSGKGARAYLMLHYHPFKQTDIWLRYGTTIYSDREIISSGPTEIDGNRKSDAGVQVITRF